MRIRHSHRQASNQASTNQPKGISVRWAEGLRSLRRDFDLDFGLDGQCSKFFPLYSVNVYLSDFSRRVFGEIIVFSGRPDVGFVYRNCANGLPLMIVSVRSVRICVARPVAKQLYSIHFGN